jgi:TolA-binding protein
MKKYILPSKTRSLFIIFFLIAVIFSGCSLWIDFTTYFNLYYNASRKFSEAEDQIKSQRKVLFTLDDVKSGTTNNKSLTEVIEKLSKLLQFFNESSYVDDALLMIGKSFYYQGDFQKALRKFDELITKYPNSDLVLEAKLWTGKADFRLKKYDDGNSILEEVKETASKEGDNEILKEVYIEQVSFLIETEDYNKAITEAGKLVEISNDAEMNATVMYEIGKLYLKLENLKDAAKAFADVQNYSPNLEIDFNSRLEYGKVQRQLGNPQASLDIFEDLKSKSLFNDYLDQTELNIGLALIDLKKTEEAFNQLTLVDSTYKQLPSSGVARYYLGKLMENEYRNLDSANVYFSKVAGSNTPPEIADSAKKENELINKYRSLKIAIRQSVRDLNYLEKPEEFLKDSVAYAIELAKIDSLNKIKQEELKNENPEESRGRNRRNTEDDLTKSPVVKQQINADLLKQPVRPKIPADSIHSIISKNEYELAGLFFTEFNRPDSAFYYYNKILTDHPKSPYKGRTLFALGTYYQTLNLNDKADSLFNIVYDNYKNESIVNAAADKLKKPLINISYDPAEERYLKAENILNNEKYNDALTELKNIYSDFPRSSYAPKAMYAQGWILENKLMLLDSAAVVFDTLSRRYANTKYSVAVLPLLNEYKNEKMRLRTKAIQDSIKAADSLKIIHKSVDSLSLADTLKNKKDSLAIKQVINRNNEINKNGNTEVKISTEKEIPVNNPDNNQKPKIPGPADTSGIKTNDLIKQQNKIIQTDSLKIKNRIP